MKGSGFTIYAIRQLLHAFAIAEAVVVLNILRIFFYSSIMKSRSTARHSSPNSRASRSSRWRQGGTRAPPSSTSSHASSRRSKASGATRSHSRGLKASRVEDDDDLKRATEKLRKSQVGSRTSRNSKQTPSSASRSRVHQAIKEGAYPSQDSYSVGRHFEGKVPFEIFTPPRGKTAPAGNKSYKIFVAPENPNTLAELCFLPVGEGTTFCLNRSCKVNHRGSGERVPVMPGEVFIMADKSRAFKEPSSNSLLWDSNLFASWTKDSVPVAEWIDRFQLFKNKADLDPHVKINPDVIGSEALFTQKVKNLQSVRKRKKPEAPTLAPLEFTLGADFAVKPEGGYSLETLGLAISTLDSVLKNLVKM